MIKNFELPEVNKIKIFLKKILKEIKRLIKLLINKITPTLFLLAKLIYKHLKPFLKKLYRLVRSIKNIDKEDIKSLFLIIKSYIKNFDIKDVIKYIKSIKFSDIKKKLWVLIPPTFVILAIFVIKIYKGVPILTSADIKPTTGDTEAMFVNNNPTFKVEFGNKNKPNEQRVRFEATPSNDNPFEVETTSEIEQNLIQKTTESILGPMPLAIEMRLQKAKIVGEVNTINTNITSTENTNNETAPNDQQTNIQDLSEEQKKIIDGLNSQLDEISKKSEEITQNVNELKQSVNDVVTESRDIYATTELIDLGRSFSEYKKGEKASGDDNKTKATVVNREVIPGVDVEYQIMAGKGLKEEIVVKKIDNYDPNCINNVNGDTKSVSEVCSIPKNSYTFLITLDPDVNFKYSIGNTNHSTGGSYFFTDKHGRYLFHFLSPYATDDKGSLTNNVTLDIKPLGIDKETGLQTLEATVTVDLKWMLDSSRSFPIRIDPSIVHDTEAEFDLGRAFNRVESYRLAPWVRLTEQSTYSDIYTVGLWHMNQTSGTTVNDSSSFGNNLTTNNMEDGDWTYAVQGYGVNLDGSNEYLSTVYDADFDFATSGFTVEAWFKHVPNSSASDVLVARYDSDQGFKIWMDDTGDMCFGIDDDSTWNPDDQACTSAVNYDDNNWHHVAGVRDSGTASIYLYVDGRMAASKTPITATTTLTSNSALLRIGADAPTAGLYWLGMIDEVRISRIAKSEEEIRADAKKRPYGTYYSSAVDVTQGRSIGSIDGLTWSENGVAINDAETPYSSTNLFAQWNFNETSGTTAKNMGIGADESLMQLGIDADGKVIISGGFTTYEGITRNYVARLNTNGTIDTSFGTGNASSKPDNSTRALSIQADGKILIGGYFTTFEGVSRRRIARLNTDGTLDTSFGSSNASSGAADMIFCIATQPDEKIVTTGAFTTYDGISRNRVARLNTDGTLDTSFGSSNASSGANSSILHATIQTDGKVIIGGNFTTYDGITRTRVARLNTNGTLDTSFGSSNASSGANQQLYSTDIQSDGKIIIGGSFTTYDGITRNYIARLNTDGTLDTSFGSSNSSSGANALIYATAIQTDGKIIVGGNFTTFDGITRNYIARLNTDGTLDTSFGSSNASSGANNNIRTISIQSDGKIIVGGYFTTFDGITKNRIVRLNTDGTLDTSFGLDNLASCGNCNLTLNNFVSTGGQDSDPSSGWTSENKRWGTGALTISNVATADTLTGSNPVGDALDPNSSDFSIEMWVKTSDYTAELFSNNAGNTTSCTSNGYYLGIDGSGYPIFYLDTNGGTAGCDVLMNTPMIKISDNNWHFIAVTVTRGVGATLYVDGKAVDTDTSVSSYSAITSTGNIQIGVNNSFRGIIDSTRFYYRALSESEIISNYMAGNIEFQTRSGSSSNPDDGTWEAWKPITSESQLGTIENIYNTTALSSSTPNTTFLDKLFGVSNTSSGANMSVDGIGIQTDGKIIIGGNFTTIDGVTRNRIARLNTSGTLDTSFGSSNAASGAPASISAIEFQSDGKPIITGWFYYFDGIYRRSVARLNTTGLLDTTFASNNSSSGPMENSFIYKALLQSDGKIIIGGNFNTYDGITRNRLARLNTNGTLDTSFGSSVAGSGADSNRVRAYKLQSDGKIVIGGNFTAYDGITRSRIARVNTDGTLDTSFGSSVAGSGVGAGSIESLFIQPDGKIIVAGSFTSYDGITRNRIARVNTDGTLDTSFGSSDASSGANGNIYNVGTQPDKKIIITGNFTAFDGITRNDIARLNTDGTLDTSFGSSDASSGSNGNIRDFSFQNDGKMIIAGSFTTFDGITRNNIARLNTGFFNTLNKKFNQVIKIGESQSMQLTLGAASSPYSTLVWNLEESSGTGAYIKDASGNSREGTPTGTTFVNGFYGKARQFDGSDDKIATTVLSSSVIQNDIGTISMWIYPTGATTPGASTNLGQAVIGDSLGQFGIYRTGTSGTDRIWVYNNDGTEDKIGITYNPNEWTHIAWVHGNGNLSAYKNGVLVASTASGVTSAMTGSIGVGYAYTSGSYFSGIIDEIKIANVALTADEIAEEFRSGSGHLISTTIPSTDLSSSSKIPFYIASDRLGTFLELTAGESKFANYEPDDNTVGLWHLEEISGSGSYLKDSSSYLNNGSEVGPIISEGKLGNGRFFDGSNDYIVFGQNGLPSGSSPRTLDVWVRFYAEPGGYRWAMAYGTATGSQTAALGFTTDTINFCGYSNDLTYSIDLAPYVGQWMHVAGVYNGTTAYIYLNGNLVASAAKTWNTVLSKAYIGRQTNDGEYIYGNVDEVRISNVARTAEEIRQAYEVGRRTHPITIDFKADLDSGNLIANTSDLSFTIDSTKYGANYKGENLYPGDKIIIKENVDGTEYISQGDVSSVDITTGAVTVASWDDGATVPASGFTIGATVFKWQREFVDLTGSLSSHRNAITNLTYRITNANQGANIYFDDFKYTSPSYLTNSSTTSNVTSTNSRYLQYRAILSTTDGYVTPYLSRATVNYTVGPFLTDLMRHGKWFLNGIKQPSWWTVTKTNIGN